MPEKTHYVDSKMKPLDSRPEGRWAYFSDEEQHVIRIALARYSVIVSDKRTVESLVKELRSVDAHAS